MLAKLGCARRKSGVAVAAQLLILGATYDAAAENKPVTSALSWVRLPGAETCISSPELAQAVEERLGRSVFVSPAAAGMPIEGRIEPKRGGGFRAHIQSVDDSGRRRGVRELSSDETDCRAFDDELVLVIAITIDPDAVLKRPTEKAEKKPARPTEEPVPARTVVKKETVFVPIVRERPQASPDHEAPREPWGLSLRAGPRVAGGVLPGAAVGLQVAVVAAPPDLFPLAAMGEGWTDTDETAAAGGARVSLISAALAACPQLRVTPVLATEVCGGGFAGAMHARGFGFDTSDETTELVAGVSAGANLLFRADSWLLFGVGVDARLALSRPRFFFRDATGTRRTLYEAPAFAGTAGLFVGVVLSGGE